MDRGLLYGVGVGPGDSELITLKAVRILKEVDIIAVPKSKYESNSTAFDIVKDYIENKKIIELIFPMSFDKEELYKSWQVSADIVMKSLDLGKNIAFITLGDPTIYSTFMYLNKIIVSSGYKTIIIPGITSFCACAAETGINLGENNDSIIIIPSASDIGDLEKKLDSFQTVILMKFRKNFEEIKKFLKAKDLIKNTVIVEKCTMTDQKVYRDIENLNKDKLEYFSTMIINKRMV